MPQTFPTIAPSYGTQKQQQYRSRTTNFGDGYEQRVADGIQNVRSVYKVQFDNITATNANTIETFLDARAGHDSFYWTPPGGSEALWTCGGMTRTETGPSSSTISAVFKEVFDI